MKKAKRSIMYCGWLSFFFSVYSVGDFKLGVENIPASFLTRIFGSEAHKSYSIGLITNQTGIDQNGKRTVDILTHKGYSVKYIFAPEHGLNGTLAERDVHDSIDNTTHIPIISLYGNGSGKMISPEHASQIDLLIFDIQDSGMRHYTYISTLLNTLKIAQEYNKPYVVLDRPNPLGSVMEGPLVSPDLISFISIAPIPLRHGMTIAELAYYFNKHVLEKPANLHVVKMKGYDRRIGFAGKFLQQLSPNLQSLQSCYGYSFLGLLGEIEPFEVGVGTDKAFQCIALPEVLNSKQTLWQDLQKLLQGYGIKSSSLSHINPKNKKVCKGLHVECADISNFRAFDLFIDILQFFKKEGIEYSFSAAFNKAVGTKNVQALMAGQLISADFSAYIRSDLEEFYKKAQPAFLYNPKPHYFNLCPLAS